METPKELTNEQKAIIDEPGNCVVIAAPGSGKTFVLSEKIKLLLGNLHNYQGVIAISFTNKASSELKKRTLSNDTEPKNSFFGTIDKFCVTEIILSFGKQIFGNPKKEFQVIDNRSLNIVDSEVLRVLETIKNNNSDNLLEEQVEVLKYLFVEEGVILLNYLGLVANYIFKNSVACMKYLQTKYSHVIIDEYQDSDFEQDKLFLNLVELNLIGIAVGDIMQAIFGFAGKKNIFLRELTIKNNFKRLPLTKNFRCHPSISNYSKIFLQTTYPNITPQLQEADECRVFQKRVNGAEINVLRWIETIIPNLKNRFSITNENQIGILVKSNRSGKFVDNNLALRHRLVSTTPLDNDVNYWSNLFINLLYFGFNSKITIFELLYNFFDIYENKYLVKKLIPVINDFQEKLNEYINNEDKTKDEVLLVFKDLAKLIYPDYENENSVNLLGIVLDNEEFLKSYLPSKEDEIQILTLFKAKGLEFDVIFHLDLYSFILPQQYKNRFSNYEQDVNLHYVGITRAKKACYLVHSSRRHNSKGKLMSAYPSEFFFNELSSYKEII